MSAIFAWLLSHVLIAGLSAVIPGAGLVTLAVRYGSDAIKWVADHRQDALLIVLAVVAAGLYAWGSHTTAVVTRDRDDLLAWAGSACASAGSTLETSGAPRGQACATAIAALARDKLSVAQQSTALMVQAEADHAARTTADTATRTAGTATMAASAAQMEKTNAQVGADDRVGGDWFRDLNRAGGLRPPAP